MYILDSDIFDILVYPSAQRSRVRSKINAVGSAHVWISIITALEKFNGLIPEIQKLLNPRNPSLAPRQVLELDALETLMAKFCDSQILSFTDEDYEVYKEIFQVVKRSPLDCRIAASAKRRNWTVVTNNAKDFDVIRDRAGVKVEYWADSPII